MSHKKDTGAMVNDLLCTRIQELEEDRDALVKQIEKYEHITTCSSCLSKLMLDNLFNAKQEEDLDLVEEESIDDGKEEVQAIITVTADMNIKTPQDLPEAVKRKLAEESIEIDKVTIVQR